MQKTIIKHLKGSKSNQIETFELPFTELIIGRDTACNIKIDENDDRVSRKHAKIIHQNGSFKLEDLNSTNGTFVNGERIQGAVELNVGDIVKMGDPGVEFSFDLDPRPEIIPKRTQFDQRASSKTREQVKSTQFETQHEVSQAKSSIGRTTVERLITESTGQTKKRIINIASGIVVIIILGASFLLYQSKKGQETLATLLNQVISDNQQTINSFQQQLPKGLTATQIAEKYSNSTVFISTSWKLIDVDSGQQLFQALGCFDDKIKLEYCSEKSTLLPLYIKDGDIVEPFLVPEARRIPKYQYAAIGSSGRGQFGSGFFVTEDGYILTNRHVVAPWQSNFAYNALTLPGILLECTNNSVCIKEGEWKYSKATLLENDPQSNIVKSLSTWVPYNQRTVNGIHQEDRVVDGRIDVLEVTLPNTTRSIKADIVSFSEKADVALIKIHLPILKNPIADTDGDVTVKAGSSVTITGYPAISADVSVKVESQDPLNRIVERKDLRIPTISTGTIGMLTNSKDFDASNYFSHMGDVYQLNVNTTGAGNSGGPVFNDEGRVIGIFTYGKSDNQGVRISFAVPIKYGEELMGKR